MTAHSEEESNARYERKQLQRRRSSIQKIIRNSNNNNSSSSYGSCSPQFAFVLSMGVMMAAIAFFAAAIQMTTTVTVVTAFVVPRHSSRPASTRIFLEDWVAELIDGELYREEHRKEYEAAWMEKNKGAVLSRLSDEGSGGYPSMMMGEEDRKTLAEHKRDERMAFMKPEKYCADRCVATGNCDILEDFYELNAHDVLKFCEECVLNFDVPEGDYDDEDDGGGGCVVPDAFYEKEPPLRP